MVEGLSGVGCDCAVVDAVLLVEEHVFLVADGFTYTGVIFNKSIVIRRTFTQALPLP